MTTDIEMDPIVRSWLESTAGSPYSTRLTVAKVMTRLPQAPRSGRWANAPKPGAIRRARFDAVLAVSAMAVASLFVGSLLAVAVLQAPRTGVGPAAGLESVSPSLIWEAVTIPDPGMHLELLGDRFVASEEGGSYRVSADGIHWGALQTDGVPLAVWHDTVVLRDEYSPVDVIVRRPDGTRSRHEFTGAAGNLEARMGPAGIVFAYCDAECDHTTVWHSADGTTWRMVAMQAGELWDELMATDGGFVASLDNGGYFTTVYSTDGVGWRPIHAGTDARYQLIGATPWGAVIRDGYRQSGPVGPVSSPGAALDSMATSLTLASATGLRDLMMSRELAAVFDDGRRWGIGAGPLGLVAIDLSDERKILFSADGVSWTIQSVPVDIPSLDPRLHEGARPAVLVGEDAVLLGAWVCLDASGSPVLCGDSEPVGVRKDWWRGTLSAD